MEKEQLQYGEISEQIAEVSGKVLKQQDSLNVSSLFSEGNLNYDIYFKKRLYDPESGHIYTFIKRIDMAEGQVQVLTQRGNEHVELTSYNFWDYGKNILHEDKLDLKEYKIKDGKKKWSAKVTDFGVSGRQEKSSSPDAYERLKAEFEAKLAGENTYLVDPTNGLVQRNSRKIGESVEIVNSNENEQLTLDSLEQEAGVPVAAAITVEALPEKEDSVIGQTMQNPPEEATEPEVAIEPDIPADLKKYIEDAQAEVDEYKRREDVIKRGERLSPDEAYDADKHAAAESRLLSFKKAATSITAGIIGGGEGQLVGQIPQIPSEENPEPIEQPREDKDAEILELKRQLRDEKRRIVDLEIEASYSALEKSELKKQVEDFDPMVLASELEYAPPAGDEDEEEIIFISRVKRLSPEEETLTFTNKYDELMERVSIENITTVEDPVTGETITGVSPDQLIYILGMRKAEFASYESEVAVISSQESVADQVSDEKPSKVEIEPEKSGVKRHKGKESTINYSFDAVYPRTDGPVVMLPRMTNAKSILDEIDEIVRSYDSNENSSEEMDELIRGIIKKHRKNMSREKLARVRFIPTVNS